MKKSNDKGVTLPHLIKGKVVYGRGRGKLLGFPTANIGVGKATPEGVFRATVLWEEKEFPAITFVGASQTFNEKTVKAETHIFDFKDNIYNQTITVVLFEKIREPKKFVSKTDLINQIRKDIQQAKSYHDLVARDYLREQ